VPGAVTSSSHRGGALVTGSQPPRPLRPLLPTA